jgi:hypothetical protein
VNANMLSTSRFNLSNKNEMTKLNSAIFTTTVAFDCGGVYSTQRLLARLSALRSRLRLGLVLVSREALSNEID